MNTFIACQRNRKGVISNILGHLREGGSVGFVVIRVRVTRSSVSPARATFFLSTFVPCIVVATLS
jgi:hypothetical protein